MSTTVVGRETTLGELAAADLGKTVHLRHELATIEAELNSIDHSSGYTGSRSMVTLKRDGWRWIKSLPSDTPVTISDETPAATEAGAR